MLHWKSRCIVRPPETMQQSQLGHFTVKPSNAIAAIIGQTLTHTALQSVRTPYCQTLKCCLAIMGQFVVRPSNNALLSQDSLLLDINMLYATVRFSPVYRCQTLCCCNPIVYCYIYNHSHDCREKMGFMTGWKGSLQRVKIRCCDWVRDFPTEVKMGMLRLGKRVPTEGKGVVLWLGERFSFRWRR